MVTVTFSQTLRSTMPQKYVARSGSVKGSR
jgi:hypothetical protein